jgi:hypothetical protein
MTSRGSWKGITSRQRDAPGRVRPALLSYCGASSVNSANASRWAVDSPRDPRQARSLRIGEGNPSRRMVLNEFSEAAAPSRGVDSGPLDPGPRPVPHPPADVPEALEGERNAAPKQRSQQRGHHPLRTSPYQRHRSGSRETAQPVSTRPTAAWRRDCRPVPGWRTRRPGPSRTGHPGRAGAPRRGRRRTPRRRTGCSPGTLARGATRHSWPGPKARSTRSRQTTRSRSPQTAAPP